MKARSVPPLMGIAAVAMLLVFLPSGCGENGNPVDPGDRPELVPCTLPDSRCWDEIPVGDGFLLPVYRTHPLDRADSTIRRVVIVVHGANRNPDDYFETMVLATSQAAALDETLVIAPHFQTSADRPGPNQPTWTSGGWKRGDPSTNLVTSDRIGSYGAVDGVLELLGNANRFPNLTKVVVTGHSAGGQYTHRFAAGSRAEDALPHLQFRYIVANPSTFLYLGPERAVEGGGFGLPDRQACPGYNNWHYGLEELNPYMLEMTLQQIRTQLVSRDVVYLAGDADTGSAALDVSCGAMLQGPNRYLRALTLFSFLGRLFPEHVHQLFEVPGVAHSSRSIYTSNEGQGALFGW